MKKNIQKDITLITSILALLLLVSLLISLLYTLDWVSPAIFSILCEGLGFIFYIIMGMVICRFIKKRALIYGMIISAILIGISFFFAFSIQSFIVLVAKQLAFLATILLFKGSH